MSYENHFSELGHSNRQIAESSIAIAAGVVSAIAVKALAKVIKIPSLVSNGLAISTGLATTVELGRHYDEVRENFSASHIPYDIDKK